MVFVVLTLVTMVALLGRFLFSPEKKRTKTGVIRIPKNYNDTTNARYAVNERGFLEEIRHDKLSSQAQ